MIEQEREGIQEWRSPVCWYSFINRRLILRLVFLVLLLILYYSFDWLLFRRLLRDSAAFVLSNIGHQVTCINPESEFVLKVDAALYAISADCTYIKLFFLLIPFCWRFDINLRINGLRLVMLAGVIWFVNLFRVSLALHLDNRGVPWSLAHTMPDLFIHLVPLAILVFLALRSDQGNR